MAAPVVAELVAESGAESPAPTPLTVLTWGGAYEASQRQAYFAAFTDATGIPIRTVHYDGGLADLRRHLASGDVTWDLVDMVYADALAACDAGLLEPLPAELLAPSPTGVAAREDFLPGLLPAVAWLTWCFRRYWPSMNGPFPELNQAPWRISLISNGSPASGRCDGYRWG
ncbi:hypothetical protein [Marinobacter sp. CA1]|uniref:hypothetical protein n=1 Tax=Marinobacter sp. CA1 TaxID=2817656 RepID=UPI001D097B55|nr:hypothetical protein [Marinobacter sp. CA1]